MLDKLKRSLEESPVVRMGEYDYFVNPVTDGIPSMDPVVLEETLITYPLFGLYFARCIRDAFPYIMCWGSDVQLVFRLRKLCDLLPNARWEPIPGAGHVVYLEKPDAFWSRLRAFVAEHGA